MPRKVLYPTASMLAALLRRNAKELRYEKQTESIHRPSDPYRDSCAQCGDKWPCPVERKASNLEAAARGLKKATVMYPREEAR